MARDFYHEHVRIALEKEGWLITGHSKSRKMDSLNALKYRQIVEKVVAQIAEYSPSDETIRVLDEKGGHYLLFNNAWEGSRRFYGCFLHIDVKDDGKVWLQHDGTDLEVANELVAAGVEKRDLVLGFQPKSVREVMEFAVA